MTNIQNFDWKSVVNIATEIHQEIDSPFRNSYYTEEVVLKLMGNHILPEFRSTSIPSTFGIESFEFTDYDDNEHTVYYLNVGDPYITTLCYDQHTGKYNYCSWGDYLDEEKFKCGYCSSYNAQILGSNEYVCFDCLYYSETGERYPELAKLVDKVNIRLLDGYTVKDGRITDPGKFEGEPPYTLYYYDCYLEGDRGELEYSDGTEHSVYLVSKEESILFDLVEGAKVLLGQTEQGFVWCRQDK
jgi:hypothetical protein